MPADQPNLDIDGVLTGLHSPEQCAGESWWAHAHSVHPLNSARVAWDEDRWIVWRQCEHGQWHPDPDAVAYVMRGRTTYVGRDRSRDPDRHDCDGCCIPDEAYPAANAVDMAAVKQVEAHQAKAGLTNSPAALDLLVTYVVADRKQREGQAIQDQGEHDG